MTKKFKKDPISASDYAITLLMDTSEPLVLSLQLFWFAPEIGIFLEKEVFWEASNRIKFESCMDFTYMPIKMEPRKRSPYEGYLLGFGSNMHNQCYNKYNIRFGTEEEKVRHKHLIENAINELVQIAMSSSNQSSPWFVWNIDK